MLYILLTLNYFRGGRCGYCWWPSGVRVLGVVRVSVGSGGGLRDVQFRGGCCIVL
jgi:hypothetical protein